MSVHMCACVCLTVAVSTILIHEYGKAPLADIQTLDCHSYDQEVSLCAF